MTRSGPPRPRGGLYFEDFAVGEVFRRRAFEQDGTRIAERRRTAFMVRRPAPATIGV
jgi:hypothetical protein